MIMSKLRKRKVRYVIIYMACLFILSVFLFACAQIGPVQETKTENISSAAEYKKITAEEAAVMMEGYDSFILLDVRTREEYQTGHIEGAVVISHEELASRAEKELPDQDSLILIYCRSGRRSELAARDLIEMGYRQVYDFGGINDWPYETVVP